MYRYLANPIKHKKNNNNSNDEEDLYLSLSKLYSNINNELYIKIKKNIDITVSEYENSIIINDIINDIINNIINKYN